MKPPRRGRSRRAAHPWFLMGALVGSATLGIRGAVPAVHASEPADRTAVIAPDRRITISRAALDASIARVRIWTPSETLLRMNDQAPSGSTALQALRFDLPPGPLGATLDAFEKLTGIRITVAEADIRTLASPGVTGLHSAERALETLLTGTGAGFRLAGPGVAVIELRARPESVDVRAPVPRPASPSFTRPVLDTPQTIAIVPREVIEAQGATTLRDVLRNVPGITYQAGEGGGGLPGDTLTMRGFSATGDIFVDGVRDSGAYSRDAFNLEQVEVVKGPASTYGGRGTTGGSINLVTKTPHLEGAHSVAISGGSARAGRATLDLNQPVGRGAAARLTAMASGAGVPGRNVVENRSWAITPSIAVGLQSRTRATLSYQHLEQDNVPDYGLPWAAFEAAPAVDQSNFYGLEDYDFEDIRNDTATLRISHSLTGAMSLRNLARYAETRRDSAITAPRPPNRQLQQRTMSHETLANQTSFDAAFKVGRTRHTVVAGLDVAREATDNRNRAQTANQPQTNLLAPDPEERPFGPMPENTGAPSAARTSTLGAYVFDTVALTDAFELTGGLRWDRSRVDYESTSLPSGVVTALSRSDRFVSWRAGAIYKPRPEGSLYAGASTSFNPSADASAAGPGLSENPNAVNNAGLEPERSRNYEVGAKWELFGSRLLAGAALLPDGEDERAHAQSRVGAVRPRGPPSRRRHRDQRDRAADVPLVTPWRLHLDGQRDSRHGKSDGAERQPRARASKLAQPVDIVRLRVAAERRRGRPVHGQRVPEHREHARGPGLLARERDGVVRRERAPDPAGQWGQSRGHQVRRSRGRRALHPRTPTIGSLHRRHQVLTKPGGGRAGTTSEAGRISRMLLHVPDVLTREQVARARTVLDAAEWVDGRVTAGHQSARTKDNLQLPESSPAALELGGMVLAALQRSPLFISAALPLRVFPPLFNRYEGGQAFGTHVDNAIRHVPGTGQRIRTDLSATLFLADPGEYDGGELSVEDTYGVHSVKLPAGHMVLYPSTSLHHVRPVTRGARIASFFWVQSMVRDDGERTLLFDLDSAIQEIADTEREQSAATTLTGVYHNLLRRWAQV